MFQKGRIVALGGCLLLAAGLCACSGKGEGKTEGKNPTVSTEPFVNETEYVNCFDVGDVFSSIVVNEQPMEYPIDVSKLKDSITVGSPEQTTTNQFYRGTLLDGDATIGTVDLYSPSGSLDVDGFVYFLEVSEGSPWKISVKDVTFGATVEDVRGTFGEPVYESGETEGTYRLYYENCSQEYMAFSFQDNALKTISLSYLPEEWRD